nr:MAG TPA: hypothetical protein [Caudoviricetes sp.]
MADFFTRTFQPLYRYFETGIFLYAYIKERWS